MRPYYERNGITIYHGDCRDVLPNLAIADVAIIDPPYGIDENSDKQKSRGKLAKPGNYGEFHWDKKLDRETIGLVMQTSVNQVIFGGNYYADWLPASSAWIVWDKDNGNNDFADCELAWTSYRKAVRKFVYRWNGMLQQDMKNKEERYHPTQKPLALMKWVIQNYLQPNDSICDSFMGSGSTLVAAKLLNHTAIGIDIEERYCEIAAKRLSQDTLGI